MKSFCILCEEITDHSPFYQILKCCRKCSLVSANIDISQEELIAIYGEKYFSGEEYFNYPNEKETLQKNFKRWISLIRKYAPAGALFEIGSAYGFFLELAQRHWEVKGMDISSPACTHAKALGLNIECGSFLDIPVAMRKYNIFCLWDTIEHLQFPNLFIKKIGEIIAPKGIICLTTGDIAAWVPRIQKNRWRLIHPPTHLYYFSSETLSFLLKKNGFKIIHLSHVGIYRSLKRSLFSLMLFHQGLWKYVYSAYDRLGLGDFPFYLNLFDIMLIIGRKEE